jgi:hypothetical protein
VHHKHSVALWLIDRLPSPHDVIVVRIEGSIGNDDAFDAASRTDALLRATKTPLEVCIDLSLMSDYTVSARERWSQVLRERKPMIRLLTWVTTKSTQRMVGRAVGLFTGLPTRLLDEMPADYGPDQPMHRSG